MNNKNSFKINCYIFLHLSNVNFPQNSQKIFSNFVWNIFLLVSPQIFLVSLKFSLIIQIFPNFLKSHRNFFALLFNFIYIFVKMFLIYSNFTHFFQVYE